MLCKLLPKTGIGNRAGIVLCGIFLAMSINSQPIPAQGIDTPLIIRVTQVEDIVGHVEIRVYNSERNWLQKPVYRKRLPVNTQEVRWRLESVPEGQYAVFAFQDKNSNGEFDTWVFDIPSEPYAYSNNVRNFIGQAKWGETRFSMAGEDEREVLIVMR